MKISFNWLKTLVNIDISAQETAALLTSGGLEVEALETYESLKGGLKGLVVGHITDCIKHPDADKLKLTKVDIGGAEPLSIVCGAPNVAANQKVIVATIGTKLYPTVGEPFEIKKSKIRGHLSEGMICAEDEFGLGKNHEGILILPNDTEIGLTAANYFKIETDTIFEIGLTPNRSDAASHLGVARDIIAILNSTKTKEKEDYKLYLKGLNPLPEATNLSKLKVVVEKPEACKRYSGLVINGIKVYESPDWLKNRLKSIGLRPINNIVDVTNFVLHELGQPLHAFDYDKIKGNKIIVRTAKEGEKFKTLDGVERNLFTNDLMICNEVEPMTIAGVFGGLESGISEKTTSIFIESAYFDSVYVRKTAKQHTLKTDASFRYERGTDPDITVTALIRAANLIFELAGGSIGMDLIDIYPEVIEPYRVAFSYTNCNALIGKEIDRNSIKQIIINLGIAIDSEGSDGLLLLVPRFKTDVTREVDVIEEVMRVYGYNNVDVSKSISYTAFNEEKNRHTVAENKVASVLEGFGFNEIMSLSLTKESYYEANNSHVKIINPLSNELGILRADMIFSGLEAISYNHNRKNFNLKFFEFGRTYSILNDSQKYSEEKQLSLFITGNAFNENPYQLDKKADFSFLKAALVGLLQKCGITNYLCNESLYSNFDYGLTYNLNNKPLAELGAVSQKLLTIFDISQPVFYARINWELLVKFNSKQKIEFEEISKFPSVRRDLALLVDKSVKYQQIEQLAYNTEKKLLKEVNLFDIYEGEKLGNKKSYAVSFTILNNEATLTDKQIEGVMDKLILNYKEKLGAELR